MPQNEDKKKGEIIRRAVGVVDAEIAADLAVLDYERLGLIADKAWAQVRGDFTGGDLHTFAQGTSKQVMLASSEVSRTGAIAATARKKLHAVVLAVRENGGLV